MKKIFLCLAALSMALFTQAKIGYVMFTVDPGGCSNLECYVPWDQDDESPERQAVSWFYNHYVDPSRTAENNYGEGKFLTVGSHVPASGTVPFSVANIADVDVLWINVDRAGSFEAIISNLLVKDDFEEIVRDFVKAGGNVLLTKQAARLVAETGRYNAVWPDFHGGAYAESATNNYSVQEWYAGTHKVYASLLDEGNMVSLSTNAKSADRSCYWTMADDDARNTFQDTYEAKVIGIEGDPANKSGLIEFYPKGDYLGTMLVMGLNSYDWGATNSLLNKVQTLTQNMLDYLSASPNVQWATGASLTAGTIGYSDALTATANDGYTVAITSSNDNIGSYSDGAAHWNYFGEATFTATATPNEASKGVVIPRNAPSGSVDKSITVSGGNASATIGYVLTAEQGWNRLSEEDTGIENPDLTTAKWFYTNYVVGSDGQFVNPANTIPAAVKVLWIHSDRVGLSSEDYYTHLGGNTFRDKLASYKDAGGNVFVSKQATRLVGDLGRNGYPSYNNGGYADEPAWRIGNRWNLSGTEINHSDHAVYKNMGTSTTISAAGRHTNNNCVWQNFDANYDQYNPQRLVQYETDHNCRVLGGWGHGDTEGVNNQLERVGFAEFYPQPATTQGTIIAMGLAAYHWANPTTAIQTLTSNILSYLSITEVPTFNWVVEPQDDMVGNTQRVQIEFKNTRLDWTASNPAIVDIEEDPEHSSDTDYKILRFKAPGEVTITATRSADGYNIPMNVTTPTTVTKAINVETNIYTRDVSLIPNYYGTICLPRAAASYEGATMFRLADKTAENGVIIEEVTEMAAGVPYIFYPSADQVRVTMTGNKADVQPANGLVGRLTGLTLTPNDNHYILAYNKIWQVDESIEVPANRAYIDMSAINAISPAPGRKRYVIKGTNTTTALEEIPADNLHNVKMLRDGNLYIIKNGVMYNAQGQVVK